MTPAQAIAQLRREIDDHEARWRAMVDDGGSATWAAAYEWNVKKALRHATIAHELRGALTVALRGRLPPTVSRNCPRCGYWACRC